MSKFGEESNLSLNEAQAHARRKGAATVHIPLTPGKARREEVRSLVEMDGLDLSDEKITAGAWRLTR